MSDLIGKKYGMLTVNKVSKITGPLGQPYMHCTCECGSEKEIRLANLVAGQTKSCGCMLKKNAKKKELSFCH